jgi:aquaporin Z
MKDVKKYVAEFIGTFVLVLLGCGVAHMTCYDNAGYVATSLAFGLVIVAMAYSVGNISGCHVNPAVSVAMLVSKKMTAKDFVGYVIAQILGAFAGSAFLGVCLGTFKYLGSNTSSKYLVDVYGDSKAMLAAFLIELVLTFIFVFTILGVTSKSEYSRVAGIVIGLALVLVHLFGIHFTGTSVNPARSIAPAVLEAIAGRTGALKQLWIFIVAPMVGGTFASLVHTFLSSESK